MAVVPLLVQYRNMQAQIWQIWQGQLSRYKDRVAQESASGRSSDFSFSTSSTSAPRPIQPPDSIKQLRNVNIRPNSITNRDVKIGDSLGLTLIATISAIY
jgi:hypothetical protein